MVNKDRIVPVEKIDLLSLYGTILKFGDVSYDLAESTDVKGTFILEANGTYLANQPVKSLDFGEATAAMVYLVAAYDFEGFKVAGSAVEAEGDEIKADGATLYEVELADSAVTVTAVTPSV